MRAGDYIKLNFTQEDLDDLDFGMSGIVLRSPYRWYKQYDVYIYIEKSEDSRDAIIEQRSRFDGVLKGIHKVPLCFIELK